jgi:hypothetical protein
MAHEQERYRIAAIRKLLVAAFTAAELRRFCQDRPTFRPIVDEFSRADGLTDMVDEVITYCERKLVFDLLLSEVEQANRPQYERFAPYRIDEELPETPALAPARDAVPGTDPPAPGEPSFDDQQKNALVGALVKCPTMMHRDTREAVIRDLPQDIQFNIRESPQLNITVRNIVDTCMNYPEGIRALLDIVRRYEGNSVAMQEIDKAVK